MANKCEQFETGSESNNSETVVDCTSKTVSSEDDIKDEADKANEGNDASGAPTLSKNQIKKMKRKEKWEQVKATKRKAEKERFKARKRECRERGEEVGPTRKQLKHNTMAKSSCQVHVVIDCDFDDFMEDKDIKMLVKQIQFSYSANRRAANPMQLHCCGIQGKTKERLESLGDYRGWDVRFHSGQYSSLFEQPSLVYLSSESPNVLSTLEDNKVYIIGGLVDHNHHKGLCYRLAEEKGIAHAQLPISDYIDMKTRKVLAINHVFEILLRYTETKDWQKAFYTVLPSRKGAVVKVNTNSGNGQTKRTEESENVNEIVNVKSDSDSQCVKAASETFLDAVDNDKKDGDSKAESRDESVRTCDVSLTQHESDSEQNCNVDQNS